MARSFGRGQATSGLKALSKRAAQEELFAGQFAETLQGPYLVVGKDAFPLSREERSEFEARAGEIFDRAALSEKHMMRWGVAVVAAAILVLPLLLDPLLAMLPPVPHIEAWLIAGTMALFVAMMQVPALRQSIDMAALKRRMIARTAGRAAIAASSVTRRGLANPYRTATTVVAWLICVPLFGLILLQYGRALGLAVPNLASDDALMAWSMQWALPAVGLAYALFALGRVRQWRIGRREAAMARTRTLASSMRVESEDDALAAFDRELSGGAIVRNRARRPF